MNGALRRIRESKGLKQIDVARKTGLSKQMISKIESPEGNPTLITLLKYLECINVDLAKVLERQFIPKKPIRKEKFMAKNRCPECNAVLLFPTLQLHCGKCGQAIDWREEECINQ